MAAGQLPSPMSSQVGEPLSSSPCAPSSSSTKQKGKPSITPRSFGRFFAPKRFSGDRSRSALSEVSPAGINARLSREDRTKIAGNSRPQIFDEDENPIWGSNSISKRRRIILSPETSPERSSPCRQSKRLKQTRSQPVTRSKYRGALGAISSRELGLSFNPFYDWRPHVGNFCSNAEDVYLNRGLQPGSSFVIPFSVAACHTNPVAAIGDEDGYIKLLDTARDESSTSKAAAEPFLTFRAHTNAIVDLEFASDDSLLATGSGDQTGRIIDMQTQKCIYELGGHMTSVKQIRFQPGISGNNVVATSSRGGKIIIYDLRCRSYGEHASHRSVHLDGIETGETLPNVAGMKYAARVSAFLPLPPRSRMNSVAAKGTKPGVSSVTCLSFLGSRPHLLLTGGEANAGVSLWDLRASGSLIDRRTEPIATTSIPAIHRRRRNFGLTSMILSANSTRLYTLCRDNSIYTYSTAHLILGNAPEYGNTSKWGRKEEVKQCPGPLYCFQHPKLKASTFYIKSALRASSQDREGLIAVGSSDECAVVFPTDERFLTRNRPTNSLALHTPPRQLLGTSAGGFTDDLPTYTVGAALDKGHEKEVTGLAWSSEGELLTVSDDMRCRVWREDPEKARQLRCQSRSGGERLLEGWAEYAGAESDDEE